MSESGAEDKDGLGKGPYSLNVSVEEPEQFETVLEEGSVDGIYLDSAHFDAVLWNELANRCHHAGKRCFLVLPHIFREEAFRYFDANKELLAERRF